MACNQYNAAVSAVPMPARIADLRVSDTGFPVPWFVSCEGGKPDFRVVKPYAIPNAYRRRLCWICGQQLGRNVAMTLGPMCAINRTISEPPSHKECAIFAARACPFLSNPRSKRNEVDLPAERTAPPGNGISRNPGAVAVWITRGYRPFNVSTGGSLFTFDDPIEVLWFASGRAATRAEVVASINSGIHILQAEAAQEGPMAIAGLVRARAEAMRYLPPQLEDAA